MRREERTIDGTNYVFSYDYNAVGAVITNAYPSGYKAMTEYDALRRVSRA